MFAWVTGRFWPRLRRTFQEWGEDDGNLLAAAMAYYTALSLFPLLLLLISGVGVFLRVTASGQNAKEQILAAIAEQGSPVLRDQVQEAMSQISGGASVGGPIGLLMLLLAAISIFAQFETALDRVWNVDDPGNKGIVASLKSALFTRGRAFLMLLGVGLLVVCVFVAGVALEATKQRLSPYIPGFLQFLWTIAQLLVTVTLNGLTFSLVYRYLPKPEVRWKDALQGGLLAAIVWEIGRQVLALWLVNSKYSSAYGVVGSFLAVMLWIYYASTIILLGAEYVQVTSRSREEHAALDDPRPA